jgi:hypothetical protein
VELEIDSDALPALMTLTVSGVLCAPTARVPKSRPEPLRLTIGCGVAEITTLRVVAALGLPTRLAVWPV